MHRALSEVVPGLWRSGRYSGAALAQLTRQERLSAVVDLRDAHRPPLLASRTYERLGLTYARVPVDESRPFDLATYECVLDVVRGRRALVHCWRGAHRTGTWIAWWRVRECGWTVEAARAEMLAHGFGRPEGHLELWRSVEVALS